MLPLLMHFALTRATNLNLNDNDDEDDDDDTH